ncbi:MAG: ATP-binding protein [Rhodothermales bacterium]|nr:ATP-binding protein [Rhodothermales bacterium]
MRLHRQLKLESSLEHMDRIVEETDQFLMPLGLDDDLAYNIVLVTTEAVTNAIEHGNAMDADKWVHVHYEATENVVEISVEDEGEGFSPSAVPDPLAEENLLAGGGRGVYLIEEIADEVEYQADGRRVVMRFKTGS